MDWAYEVWDQLLEWITDRDNHRRSCSDEKNYTLIRYDDEEIKQTALQLIESEENIKYRKKYATTW